MPAHATRTSVWSWSSRRTRSRARHATGRHAAATKAPDAVQHRACGFKGAQRPPIPTPSPQGGRHRKESAAIRQTVGKEPVLGVPSADGVSAVASAEAPSHLDPRFVSPSDAADHPRSTP